MGKQKINKIYYAYMFFKVLYEDFRRGYQAKKLNGSVAVFDGAPASRVRLDDLGNLIIQNTNSRCGGRLNEWQRNLDLTKFAAQKSDGLLRRQDS